MRIGPARQQPSVAVLRKAVRRDVQDHHVIVATQPFVQAIGEVLHLVLILQAAQN